MSLLARLVRLERRHSAEHARTAPAWPVRLYRPGETPIAPVDGAGAVIWLPDNGRDAADVQPEGRA